MFVGNDIAQLIHQAIGVAQAEGDLPAFEIPNIPVEHPKQAERGDYASSIALATARLAKRSPLQIAEAIVKYLPRAEYIGKVEIAPPGFINFWFSDAWLTRQVEEILRAGNEFGNVDIGKRKSVQIEFVSVNPTGPMHMGSGRNAVIGDTLANVLNAAGYRVYREYYINDRGTQIRVFSESLYARYAQACGVDEPMPEKGYHGAYMADLGKKIAAEHGNKFLEMKREDALAEIGEEGLKHTIAGLREDLALIDVHYDKWFSERSLFQDDTYTQVMKILRDNGFIAKKEGAVWFTSTELGEDKDNVLVRSDGEPTYFASDIAYHYDKLALRGFDWAIDVWGADHHGHVPRMKTALKALGIAPDRLTVILYQLVTLKRSGEVVRLSKRTGDIITLREVVEEVGADATRYHLLARSPEAQMDFDLDLAKKQSEENPVYYVQYSHARICSIIEYAQERVANFVDGDLTLLTHAAELDLIRQMLRLPEVIEQAAQKLSPHTLPFYAQELAAQFHSFYTQCRVVSHNPEDEPISKARLKLVHAARIVLARTLRLMGVSAPEKM